jgi:hypothetical protein
MISISDSALSFTVLRYSRWIRLEVGVERQLRHADDAVHRRPDFVRHVGEELAFRAARRLCCFLGGDELGGTDLHLLLEAFTLLPQL